MTRHQRLPSVDYRRILYVTDLSEVGRHAFPHAASLARRYQAELVVFHVLPTVEFERSVVGFISEAMWEDLKTRSLDEARELLVSRKREDVSLRNVVDDQLRQVSAGEGAGDGVSYEIRLKAGDPTEEILREAHEGGYDLLVMANHGEHTLRDRLMGSTAWRVLHGARIPVVLVRVPDE